MSTENIPELLYMYTHTHLSNNWVCPVLCLCRLMSVHPALVSGQLLLQHFYCWVCLLALKPGLYFTSDVKNKCKCAEGRTGSWAGDWSRKSSHSSLKAEQTAQPANLGEAELQKAPGLCLTTTTTTHSVLYRPNFSLELPEE